MTTQTATAIDIYAGKDPKEIMALLHRQSGTVIDELYSHFGIPREEDIYQLAARCSEGWKHTKRTSAGW